MLELIQSGVQPQSLISKGGVIQFQVPQNINLEDKIVGSLTLIQFLYLLTGGIVDYILLTMTGGNFIFWLFGIPIAIVSLALAFLKIQDQPLSHFVKAGLFYWNRPKLRVWQRQGYTAPIFKEAPKPKKVEAPIIKRQIEKSELEQLAQSLDTQSVQPQEAKNLGKASENFEKLLKEQPQKQGGRVGTMGQVPTTNR